MATEHDSFKAPAATYVMPPNTDVDYYDVLGVQANATKLQIREAYLRQKATFHNESMALYSIVSEEDARRNLSLVEEAYSVLDDDARRALYDRSRGVRGAESYARDERRPHESENREAQWRPGPGEDTGRSGAVADRARFVPVRLFANRAQDPAYKDSVAAIVSGAEAGDGQLFKRLRENALVSRAEMQERTKISFEYIVAFEESLFEKLPQIVYIKGFLRGYLRYIAIPDPEPLVQAFAARYLAWLDAKQK